MNKENFFNVLNIEDINDAPSAIFKILKSDLPERNKKYNELLELNQHNLSYDWFGVLYESELAQRDQKKQDFTPNAVGILLSKITGTDKGKIYEPTAGNGSLLISNWWHRVKMISDFIPKEHPVECWELSNRSIPILLLNLSIRGVVGTVYHGDVLTKKIIQKYELINTSGRLGDFSEIITS